MILLCGPFSDPVLYHFAGYLLTQGIDFLFLDQREYGREIQLAWAITHATVKGFLDYGRWRVPLEALSGVFIRWELDQEDFDPKLGATKRERRQAQVRLYENLAILLDHLPAVVVNRPSATLAIGSKPQQLWLIRKVGFEIPDTLVTNDPATAEQFWREYGGNVIVKSLGTTRSVVRKLSESDLSRLHLLTICPIQLQERIDGTHVRVHVIGGEVFATKINTDAVDYRYAAEFGCSCEMEPIELPIEIARRCMELTRLLGLHLGGIDLCRRPNGRWVCFEVNTAPAFTWFEVEARQPMCPELAVQLGAVESVKNHRRE